MLRQYSAKRRVIVPVLVLGLLLAGYVVWRGYMSWLDWRFIHKYSYFFEYQMPIDEALSGHTIEDFVPNDFPTGEIYWLDVENDKRFAKLPGGTRLYAVRFDPQGEGLKFYGKRRFADVQGMVAWPGPDGTVDYDAATHDVRNCTDPDEAMSLEGVDIVFLFCEEVNVDAYELLRDVEEKAGIHDSPKDVSG